MDYAKWLVIVAGFCVAGVAGAGSRVGGTTTVPAAQGAVGGKIDALEYVLQSDDTGEAWTLGGAETRPGKDPDGGGAVTYVHNKWSNPNIYEVYKVTADDLLEIRYEVVRSDPVKGKGNWIRRYHEVGRPATDGSVWIPRYAELGKGYLSRVAHDRFVFDTTKHAYVIDEKGSGDKFQIWTTASIVTNDWGDHNRTGFELNPCLRLTAEWQREGKIFEMYDYAKGKGIVAWRWLERVGTMPKEEAAHDENVFRCENGHVYVASTGDERTPPEVFKYDLQTGTKGEKLETIRFASHWAPERGEQWYVIFRNSIREHPLEKKMERIGQTYALPEWTAKPGATIADLPEGFTKGK